MEHRPKGDASLNIMSNCADDVRPAAAGAMHAYAANDRTA